MVGTRTRARIIVTVGLLVANAYAGLLLRLDRPVGEPLYALTLASALAFGLDRLLSVRPFRRDSTLDTGRGDQGGASR